MSETLDTERTEPLFLSGSAITSPNGTTVRSTVAHRTFKREQVAVQNTPPEMDGRDHPLFYGRYQNAFVRARLVPLKSVQYWLRWGNQLTVSTGESAFDFPTADMLRGFLDVPLQHYAKEDEEFTEVVEMPKGPTVPLATYTAFMERVKDFDREALMNALDAFVGQYL